MNFPLSAFNDFGLDGSLLISLCIGLGFGFMLERGGFGSSKVLAGIFYGRDWRVLKVMFTAIVVAMLGLFLADGAGLLVMDQMAYRSTYIYSQVIGGLILGVGFVTAGYCPGTSIVGAVSGKLDAIFTLIGVVLGIGVFEELYVFVKDFYNAGYMGELSIAEWSGVPQGIVVIGVVLMAVAAFWAVEKFGPDGALKGEGKRAATPMLLRSAGSVLALGAIVMVVQFAGPGQSRVINACGNLELAVTPEVEALEVAGWVVEARPDLMLIDVRADSGGVELPGAVSIEAGDLLDYRKRPDLVDTRLIVVVDVDGGEVAQRVVRSLRKAGLDAAMMSGGAKSWSDEVLAKVDPDLAEGLDPRAAALQMLVSGESVFDGAAPPPPPKKGAAPPPRKKKKGGGC